MSVSDQCVRLSIQRRFNRGADEVFRAVCDHERLPAWLLPGAQVVMKTNREGRAIREIRKWFFVGREEILSCEASGRLEYRIIDGLPVQHHHARVSVVSAGAGGSLLTWEVEYDSGYSFVNLVVARSIRKTLERGLERLPDYLERCP